MQWSVKRGIQNKGEPDIGTAEPWMHENLAQLSSSLGLPADQFKHIQVPSSTAEKFGVDFVPEELDQLAAKAAEEEGRAAVEEELSEEDERLLAANTLDALRFQGKLQHTAVQKKMPKLSGSLFTWWAGTFLARHKPGKLIFYKRWSHSWHMQTMCLSSQCHGGCAAVQQDPPSQRAAAQAPVPPQLKPTAASRASAGYLAACNKATIKLPKRRVHSQACVLALACKYTMWHHGLLIHLHCQESCCRNWSGVQECLVGPWYFFIFFSSTGKKCQLLPCHNFDNSGKLSSTMQKVISYCQCSDRECTFVVVSPLRRSPRQFAQPAAAAAPLVTTQAQGYTIRILWQVHYHAFHSTGVIGKPCSVCKHPFRCVLAACNYYFLLFWQHWPSVKFTSLPIYWIRSSVSITQGRWGNLVSLHLWKAGRLLQVLQPQGTELGAPALLWSGLAQD